MSDGKRPPLLTVEQVAEMLSVSSAYVRRRLVFEQRIPYVKIGRHVRIDQRDLEDFIDRGRVTPAGYKGAGAPPKRRKRSTSREGRRRWPTSGNTP